MSQKMQQKTTIQPLEDRVLLQRLEQKETLKGGIILPDTAKTKQEIATVVAIGKGKTTEDGKLIPIPVSIGDNVLIDKYAGQEVTVDDQEYVVVKAGDIVAIVQE